eukprot:scaffold2390_cov280-Prasinococcus_capsulatus_cf.AAC.1
MAAMTIAPCRAAPAECRARPLDKAPAAGLVEARGRGVRGGPDVAPLLDGPPRGRECGPRGAFWPRSGPEIAPQAPIMGSPRSPPRGSPWGALSRRPAVARPIRATAGANVGRQRVGAWTEPWSSVKARTS